MSLKLLKVYWFIVLLFEIRTNARILLICALHRRRAKISGARTTASVPAVIIKSQGQKTSVKVELQFFLQHVINALNVIKTANVEKEKPWAVMLERKKSLILRQLSCDLSKLFI